MDFRAFHHHHHHHHHHNHEPPPEIRPCIAELLRTGYHAPNLLLRVERIIEVAIPILSAHDERHDDSVDGQNNNAIQQRHVGSGQRRGGGLAHRRRRAYRLFLSDGELIIQALLRKELHLFVSTGEITAGTIVRVERYEVRRGKRVGEDTSTTAGETGKTGQGQQQVVFLAVEAIRGVFWGVGSEGPDLRGSEAVRRKRGSEDGEECGGLSPEKKRVKVDGLGNAVHGWEEEEERDSGGISTAKGTAIAVEAAKSPEPIDKQRLETPLETTTQLEREFDVDLLESPTPSPDAAKDERPSPSLQSPPQQASCPETTSAQQQIEPHSPTPQPPTTTTTTKHAPPPPPPPPAFPFTLSSTEPLKPIDRPLNLLTLADLVHPTKKSIPRRNYLCDIFAVISWISPVTIKRSSMPAKRDLRVLDPTITSSASSSSSARPAVAVAGLSVSVFVDAEKFDPPVGTVALFRSLKTHEWEGISLNAYERDCAGREWVIADPVRLRAEGYDVEGLRGWWEHREEERIGGFGEIDE